MSSGPNATDATDAARDSRREDDTGPASASGVAESESAEETPEARAEDAEAIAADEVLEPPAGDEGDGADDGSAAASAALVPVESAVEYGPVSALTRYMSQLRHHAPISREEEHELAVRWVEEGDVDAARQLVMANLRLVVKIAMEYRRAWTNTLDLIQEGNIGLMEAVQRYDPYRGVKLSSYAVYWIRAYLLKYILDNMRSTRMGTTRAERKLFFRLNKEKRELERQGYEVEPRLIAERLDVSEEDVVNMEARLAQPDLSLDAPAWRDDAEGDTFGDRIEGPGTTAERAVGDAEMRDAFHEHVETFADGLGERDLQILRERILADPPKTLAELGEEFGVSRERVRQLEARLIKALRAHFEQQMVDFEYYAPGDD